MLQLSRALNECETCLVTSRPTSFIRCSLGIYIVDQTVKVSVFVLVRNLQPNMSSNRPFLCILLACLSASSLLSRAQFANSDAHAAHELDVSWDFNDNGDTLGWGNSTTEEMNMEVKAENGELRCSIIGLSPKLESPRLFLNVSHRHYVIMRAKYLGAAQDARMLLRSGGSPSPNKQLDLGTLFTGLNVFHWTL